MAYPILAPNSTWFAPNDTTITRSIITEIEFVDSYTPDTSVTVRDSWDASAAKDGSITCYVIGTKVIVAGNGSGKIAANEDSRCLFYYIERGTSDTTKQFSKLQSLKIDILDTSNVIDMNTMFAMCSSLTSLDLTNFDTSKATDISSMFVMCSSLTSLDLTNFDTSNVTNMCELFAVCSSLTSVDLTGLDTSNVTTMYCMFMMCSSLEEIDVSNFNVSKVTSMRYMFGDCSKLSRLEIENWNTSSCTDMSYMFYNCSVLASIGDLSNWNTSKVTTMNHMFGSCSRLSGLDMSKWNFSSCVDISFMFWGASSIKEIDVSKWDVSKVQTFDHFAAHAGLRRKGIENWKITSAINLNALFHNCAEEELDLSGWDTSKVQCFTQMFENSPNLKHIKGLDKWDTSNAVGFDEMFGRCYKLEELDLSSWDTSKAKNGVKVSTNGHTTGTFRNFCNDCQNLKWIKLGPNFAVNGDGTNTNAEYKLILPTPSTDYIDGADGMWYTINGDSFAPNALPDRTANTYYPSYKIVAEADVIVKNGDLIDIAKAIREKNGGANRYSISQFGAAIRELQ